MSERLIVLVLKASERLKQVVPWVRIPPAPPNYYLHGIIAQLVEHWTENPGVGGSNPPSPI